MLLAPAAPLRVVVKWILLASVIGALTGLVDAGFISLVHLAVAESNHYERIFYLLPVTFFVTALLSRFVFRNDLSTDKLIEAIDHHHGRVSKGFVPNKVINVFLILVTGGSAGKESPCAQIGAGLASLCAGALKATDADRRKMVICGISAGFACVFGAPVTGALFGIELLAVGLLQYDVLLPAFVASITAYHLSAALGITFFNYPLPAIPPFRESFFVILFVGGIFFGLCANGFVRALRLAQDFTARLPLWRPLQGILGGLLLVGLTLLFSRDYLGLGLDQTETCLKGQPVPWYAFLVKGLFTVITLSISRSGSVITPILFMGATAGSLFGGLFGENRSTFAAIGFVSILAGATNAPIAMSVLAMEMFGPGIAPYAAVSCIISFLLSGNQGVYPSQMQTFTKPGAPESKAGQAS